ncbi:MAG TPA: GNAT family N-acetyltransferase [Mycobacteriales bacterium]
MGRVVHGGIDVCDATEADLPILLALFAELDPSQPALLRRGRNIVGPRDAEMTAAGFRAAIADPQRRVVLARWDGAPVGLAVFSLVPTGSLVCDPALRVDPLVVARRARRRGVGNALMAAGVSFAEQHGAAVVSVSLRPTDRDGNRHFARMGFVPAEVRRVAPLAAVRRAVGGGARADVPEPAVLRRRPRELRRVGAHRPRQRAS